MEIAIIPTLVASLVMSVFISPYMLLVTLLILIFWAFCRINLIV